MMIKYGDKINAMDLMNIQNSPEKLKHHVDETCYSEAKALETALRKLSLEERVNKEIFINRVVFSNTGNSKDDAIMEKYLCKFKNPSKIETLSDVEFELKDI